MFQNWLEPKPTKHDKGRNIHSMAHFVVKKEGRNIHSMAHFVVKKEGINEGSKKVEKIEKVDCQIINVFPVTERAFLQEGVFKTVSMRIVLTLEIK